MKKKISSIAAAVIVVLFAVFFLVVTIFREKGKWSYQENRALAGFPEFTFSSLADGSFCDGLSAYFTDHFAGRSYWISANGMMEANIGEKLVNGVFIADNMLLEASCCDEPVTGESVSAFNEFAEGYDGTVYLLAVPSSAGVYSEALPEYLTHSTEKQKIDSFYASLDSSIRKIDAYNILKMLNSNYIYYRNDSKWTSYGAYCVYRTVIQKLGFLPSAYEKYTIEHVSGDFRGNLYNRTQYSGVKADILDVYTYNDGAEIVSCTGYNIDGTSYEKTLYDKTYIGTNDMYKLYLGEDVPLVRITTTVNNDRRLLVIKDSYANCFIPFLTQHYSEIAVVSPECINGEMSALINRDDYEQTLFLFGIESLSNDEIFSCINK